MLDMENIGGIVEFDTGSVETYILDTIYEPLTLAVRFLVVKSPIYLIETWCWPSGLLSQKNKNKHW